MEVKSMGFWNKLFGSKDPPPARPARPATNASSVSPGPPKAPPKSAHATTELMKLLSSGTLNEAQEERAKALIAAGADANAKNNLGYTAATLAEDSPDIVALLGAKPPTATLKDAVRNCEYEVVKQMLRKGADVNAKDEKGETLLHWAAYKGSFEMVK